MKTILLLAIFVFLISCSHMTKPFHPCVNFEHPQTGEKARCIYPYWNGMWGGLIGSNFQMDACIRLQEAKGFVRIEK